VKSCDELVDRLPRSCLLKSLPREELEALLALGSPRRFATGEMVVRQGDPGDSMMVVITGLLRASLFSENGKEILLAYIHAGDVVGEIAVLDGGPRSATVTAEESSELLIVERAKLAPFLAEHGHVGVSLIVSLCRRLRNATDMLSEHSNLGVPQRLARAILRLAVEMSPQGSEMRVRELKLRQSDLGSYTGLARENVNRQLREWVDAGWLELGRGRMIIKDSAALEKIAGSLG
jgi:CRP-like cAMP-binding protein